MVQEVILLSSSSRLYCVVRISRSARQGLSQNDLLYRGKYHFHNVMLGMLTDSGSGMVSFCIAVSSTYQAAVHKMEMAEILIWYLDSFGELEIAYLCVDKDSRIGLTDLRV